MIKGVYRVGLLAFIFARLYVFNYFRKPFR